jgi:hypothetical protein
MTKTLLMSIVVVSILINFPVLVIHTKSFLLIAFECFTVQNGLRNIQFGGKYYLHSDLQEDIKDIQKKHELNLTLLWFVC